MPADSVSDNRLVMDSLRRIVHALQVGSQAAQRKIGISGAQLFLLQILASSDAMSVNELALQTHTHQSSVSTVISRLVAVKLVKRTQSKADGRRLEVSISAAGRRLLKKQVVPPQARIISALDRLPPKRLRQLRLLLGELVKNSGLDAGTPPMFFEAK